MQKRWCYGRFVACCVKHTDGCVGIFCIEIQKTTESNPKYFYHQISILFWGELRQETANPISIEFFVKRKNKTSINLLSSLL